MQQTIQQTVAFPEIGVEGGWGSISGVVATFSDVGRTLIFVIATTRAA